MKLRRLLLLAKTFLIVCSYIEIVSKKRSKYKLAMEQIYDDDNPLRCARVAIMKSGSSSLGKPEGVFWFNKESDDYAACAKLGIDLESESWEIRPQDRFHIEECVKSLCLALEEVRKS